jgi:adenosylcobinamide-GDP ribazoletransferase
MRLGYQKGKSLKLSFLAALKFLTIIRFPLRREATPEELGCSQVYFPVVGIIIGLILAGLNWLLGLALPPTVVNVLLIASLAGITGALHLDGFADTCDGIGGQKAVEARWQAMRDSRVGGFGVIGVSLLLLVKFISLNSVPPSMMTLTLILMPVISRWAMVYALFAYPYARPEGLGTVFKQQASPQRFSVATIITLAVVMLLTLLPNVAYSYLAALVLMGGTWVIATAAATYLKRKFVGLTGDNYGAINEIAEVSVLILVSMLAHNQWLGLA